MLLAAPKLLSYTEEAKIAQIKSDTKAVEDAVHLYMVDNDDQLPEGATDYSIENVETAIGEGRVFNREGVVDQVALTIYYNLTNKDVSLEITYSDDSEIKEYKIGSGSWTSYAQSLVLTENATVYARATDLAGNVCDEVSYVVANIDKAAPIITVGNYNTSPTNQNITVIASTNKGILNKTSHTFTANGSFEFIATDAAGNSSSKQVTISNIDKVAPVIIINNPYASAAIVTKDFAVTASVNEGSLNKTSHTFTSNGSFEFTATDAAGNTSKKSVSVSNIDKHWLFDEASASVNGYTGDLSPGPYAGYVLDIPKKLNNVAVSKIGNNAFVDRKITRLVIPETVTHIGSEAFAKNLIVVISCGSNSMSGGVDFNKLGVTNVGEGAFRENPHLTTITLSNKIVSIGSEVFLGPPVQTNNGTWKHVNPTKVIVPSGFNINKLGSFVFDLAYNPRITDETRFYDVFKANYSTPGTYNLSYPPGYSAHQWIKE